LSTDLNQELRALGLSPEQIATHRERLMAAIARNEKPLFKVVDTCRVDNGGLLPEDALARLVAAGAPRPPAAAGTGIVGFVPAAGAASRYSQPLATLVEALESGDANATVQSLGALRDEGALSWPLPDAIRRLLQNPEQGRSLAPDARALAAKMLSLPKALMPCVGEGTTFFAVKAHEHDAVNGLEGAVYVTPLGAGPQFKDALPAAAKRHAAFLEQGPALSTIRFRRDGEPFREADGKPSLVPAGHGALATLFPEVRGAFPQATALFIRNIDNVMGVTPVTVAATEAFLALFQTLHASMRQIRGALVEGRLAEAAEVARPLRALAPAGIGRQRVETFLRSLGSEAERTLWEVQLKLFHTRPPEAPLADDSTRVFHLARLYERPLNILGQVPNSGKDVGGTPCFVETPRGIEKVCIEVPHVSEHDKTVYLADPARATHFNPVFAVCEVTAEPDYYAEQNEDFWLMAEKTYRGEKVVYYETVLYELIGNSGTANALFAAVPRSLFNPHKVLKDAVNRSLRDWGLS
jgi:hypothetical protein